MALDKFQIISLAMDKISANAVASFEDNSEEARIASSSYATIYASALERTPWGFASKIVKLSQITSLTQAQMNNYEYAYIVPTDSLSIQKVFSDSGEQRPYEYELSVIGEQKIILVNSRDVSIAYTYTPNESVLPSSFTQFFIFRLAYDFAIQLSISSEITQQMLGFSEKYFKEAQANDKLQQAPIPVTVGRLRGSRFRNFSGRISASNINFGN